MVLAIEILSDQDQVSQDMEKIISHQNGQSSFPVCFIKHSQTLAQEASVTVHHSW